MLVILSIAVLILAFYLYNNNYQRTVEKEMHNSEVQKLDMLRTNANLNESYNKVKSICSKIKTKYTNNEITSEDKYRYKVIREKSHSILAKGHIYNDMFLETYWSFSSTDKKIVLNLSFGVFENNTLVKTFMERDSEESIAAYVYEIIAERRKT
jgi:hypothetical protein